MSDDLGNVEVSASLGNDVELCGTAWGLCDQGRRSPEFIDPSARFRVSTITKVIVVRRRPWSLHVRPRPSIPDDDLSTRGNARMGERDDRSSIEGRRSIERWRASRVSPTEVARVSGRQRSTIIQVLRRNPSADRSVPEVVRNFAGAVQLRGGGSACTSARARAPCSSPGPNGQADRKRRDGEEDRRAHAAGSGRFPHMPGNDVPAPSIEGREAPGSAAASADALDEPATATARGSAYRRSSAACPASCSDPRPSRTVPGPAIGRKSSSYSCTAPDRRTSYRWSNASAALPRS